MYIFENFLRYQKLQKSNKLLTNSSDLKEKCVTIELNYPGLFNCNDSRVQFLEKKLTLLKIVERNFQNLVEFQTDLNGRLNEEVTELRELKHNAATCLNQWQNKCLHFAKTFDGFQQNLTATILQTNIQEHLVSRFINFNYEFLFNQIMIFRKTTCLPTLRIWKKLIKKY